MITHTETHSGPSANITWVALVWTLCLSVGYTLVGRLSDIFGRRWFFTGAAALATIGCIVGATAQSVNQLIGANVLIGLAAAGQLSFNYTIAELVPVKHRFISLAAIFLFAVPFSGFGPYISRLFIAHTTKGWRWDYYLNIIVSTWKGRMDDFSYLYMLISKQTVSRRLSISSSITHPTLRPCTHTAAQSCRSSRIWITSALFCSQLVSCFS